MATDSGIGGDGYHATFYSDRSWENYTRILSSIVRHAPPGRILDLGAGCGYLIEAANRWNIPAIGLEGSETAVGMAKSRAQNLDIRIHALSNPIPFPADHFNTVVLNQVIEHLDPEIALAVLKEAHRVLSPRGMLFITSPSRFNTKERDADPTHINLMSPADLRQIVLESGFHRTISFNSPLPMLGLSRLGLGLMELLFKIAPIDRLSATANLLAFKPDSQKA